MDLNELKAITKRIQALRRSEMKHWLELGSLLSRGRDCLGTDDGFRSYLRKIGIAKRTAYKAMAAHRDFDGVPRSAQYSKEAMAILSKSIEARSDAIDVSKKQRITARTAKSLVAKYVIAITPTQKDDEDEGTFLQLFDFGNIQVIVRAKVEPTRGDLMGALASAAKEVRDSSRRVA